MVCVSKKHRDIFGKENQQKQTELKMDSLQKQNQKYATEIAALKKQNAEFQEKLLAEFHKKTSPPKPPHLKMIRVTDNSVSVQISKKKTLKKNTKKICCYFFEFSYFFFADRNHSKQRELSGFRK